MLHNYFFIRQLSQALHKKLKGWQLATSFSQNKNELVLGFLQGQEQYYLRANLDPNINLLTFSDEFHRARKNSIDLYQTLMGQEVAQISQVPYDRSFAVEFSQGDLLIFKLHGRRSNIIHRRPKGGADVFRNNLGADAVVTPTSLAKEVNMDTPEASDVATLRQLMGKQYLGDDTDDPKVLPLARRLLDADTFYIFHTPGKPPGIHLLERPHVAVTKDPMEACSMLFRSHMQGYLFAAEKATLEKELEKRMQRSQHYVQRNEKELQSLTNKRGYEEIANIIMANLHQIPPAGGEVTLHDFYSDEPLTIKIKQGTKPQTHAENLYRKSKNQKIQLNKLQENIDAKLEQMAALEELQTSLQTIDNFKDLRAFQKQHQLDPKRPADEEVILPYNKRDYEGYDILIGKNAKSNDELTLRHTHKEDLWLHARDVPGSHVVIRRKGKASIPNHIIEKAAALAAYYSKRKTDSLCPVIVTPRKYVRKRKGSAPGEVIVEREEVVMVQPSGS